VSGWKRVLGVGGRGSRMNLSSKGGLGKKSKCQNNYKYTSFDI